MIDVSTLTDYTFAEIKIAAKHAMIAAAVGNATLSINGRTIGRITPDQAQRLYDWASQQAAIEDTSSIGGVALVEYLR